MLDLLIVALCLLLNAFFSAYEMAFVTVSKEEVDELEETKKIISRRLDRFKKKPERTLSIIQIGITLVGAIAAAVGGTGAVENLEPYLIKNYQLSSSMAEGIAVTVVILPLTYFSVVFGELLPKTIALKHPTKVLIFGTTALSFIDKMLSPIITFLEVSTNVLLKVIGVSNKIEEEDSFSQIIDIGTLPDYHQKFVENLVSLKSRKVLKSMLSWEKVIYLNFSDSEEEIRLKIGSYPHSRFPVMDGDTLVGILNVKEMPSRDANIPWEGILRPALKVAATDKVLDAFLKMQAKQTHLAVVTSGNEHIVGIITIEDILEEIVGDIYEKIDISRTSKMLSNRSKINLSPPLNK